MSLKPFLQISFADDAFFIKEAQNAKKPGATPKDFADSAGDRLLVMHALRERLGSVRVELLRVYDTEDFGGFPNPENFAAIVIAGSRHYVREESEFEWMPRMFEFIRLTVAKEVPLFGICFGHQSIAHALGGKVGPLDDGKHFQGPRSIRRAVIERNDPILNDMPAEFQAFFVHSDHIQRLPEGAELLADSERGIAEIVRFAQAAYGVQFHPEFSHRVMAELSLGRHAPEDQLSAHEAQFRQGVAAEKVLDNFVRMVT